MIGGALLAGAATAAEAQGSAPVTVAAADVSSLATNLDITLYLESSERVRQAAALDQASRMPVGTWVSWVDEETHASGRAVALRDYISSAGASCRDYHIVIEVPARTVMIWTASFNTYNNSAVSRQMPQQVSPAHTREYMAQVCGAPGGFASAGH
jgi:surface antigen